MTKLDPETVRNGEQAAEQERRIAEMERRIEQLERQMFPNLYPRQPFMPSIPPGWQPEYQCSVCKMKFSGAMGYVCPRGNCPSRVTALANHKGSGGE
ncbi:hypothetical protein SLG_21960 [Sphingobium sp. SYK-6]|uniref:hypothetical protein n=1 Tax=Sphingobium sp. (strain NBRC 103272 / SYK-6) TaxID=627192 RepID=UPI00022770BF|nr:hypothetical protein [Sphingobium sp. SYK-6]BAK66871.1 hypothetical protein SLG_21960 [Sphingobium sp. SYK-6]